MTYMMHSLNGVTKRDNPKSRCIKDWKNFDQVKMDYIVGEVGCRPPFWKENSNIDICSNSTLAKFSLHSFFDSIWSYRHPPCKFISQMHLTYQEDDYTDEESGEKTV